MIEVVRFIVSVFFKICFRVRITGKENIPAEGGAVMCANHIGELDMFVIGYRIKRLVHWMAKEELFKIPIVTPLIKWLGAFPVKRGRPDVEAIKKAMGLVHDGNIVGIFPEGTRMKNKKNKKVKVSRSAVMIAEKCAVPVIPVAIHGNYKLFSRIDVVFGKPIDITTDKKEGAHTPEEMEEMSVNIMNNIYSLLGEK